MEMDVGKKHKRFIICCFSSSFINLLCHFCAHCLLCGSARSLPFAPFRSVRAGFKITCSGRLQNYFENRSLVVSYFKVGAVYNALFCNHVISSPPVRRRRAAPGQPRRPPPAATSEGSPLLSPPPGASQAKPACRNGDGGNSP